MMSPWDITGLTSTPHRENWSWCTCTLLNLNSTVPFSHLRWTQAWCPDQTQHPSPLLFLCCCGMQEASALGAMGWLWYSLRTRKVVTGLSLAGSSSDDFLKKEGCASAGRDAETLQRVYSCCFKKWGFMRVLEFPSLLMKAYSTTSICSIISAGKGMAAFMILPYTWKCQAAFLFFTILQYWSQLLDKCK